MRSIAICWNQLLHRFCIIWLLLVLLSTVEMISHHHLREFALNPANLSITNFAFEANPRPPEWFHRILGSEAVFFRKLSDYPDRHYGMNHITRGKKNFKDNLYFDIPEYAYWPECSVEMLGFVRIGSEEPFRGKGSHDRDHLAVGQAVLMMTSGQSSGMRLLCMYRALYENWREDDYNDTFYTVPFYCPAEPATNKCRRFQASFYDAENHGSRVDVNFHLEMILPSFILAERGRVRRVQQNRAWAVDLTVYRDSNYKPTLTGSLLREQLQHLAVGNTALNVTHDWKYFANSSAGVVERLSNKPKFAVCTAQVYLTSDDEKISLNQALTFEFVRYYAMLGIKVMLYDRGGATSSGAFESQYAKANWPKGKYKNVINEYLDYHNWTVHGLLDLNRSIIRSDMQEQMDIPETLRRQWRHSTASWRSDKGLTYSHCRFEAKAKYGISDVIVVDFDEFFYCKDAPATFEGQASYIEKFFSILRRERREQVMFGKTTVASRARTGSTVKGCVAAEVAKASNAANSSQPASIFNCITSIDYIDNVPFIKSVHLGHVCPMTSRHSACAPCSESEQRCYPLRQNYKYYDCICDSIRLLGTCDFIHLSLVEQEYHTDAVREKVGNDSIMASPSELLLLLNHSMH